MAATFCCSLSEASRLQQRLRSHPGLQDDQVMLLTPADASARRFDGWRQRWDRLRPPLPARAVPSPAQQLVSGLLTGLLTGLLVGLSAGLLGNALPEAMPAIAALSAFAGGVVALLMLVVASGASPTHRFDRQLRQHLGRGLHAVVVRNVKGQHMVKDILAALRKGGVYWCAETPITRR